MIEVTDIYLPVYFQTHKIVIFLLAQFVLVQHVQALSYLKIDIEDVKAPQVNFNRLSVTLTNLAEDNSHIRLTSKKIIPASGKELTVGQLSLDCEEADLKNENLSCKSATYSFKNKSINASNGKLSLAYNPVTTSIVAKASGLKLFSGDVSVELAGSRSSDIQLFAKLNQVALKQSELSTIIPTLPGEIDFESLISGDVSLQLKNNTRSLNYDLKLKGLAFSNKAGDYLGENATLRITGDQLTHREKHSVNKLKLAVSDGEILTPYFYSNFKQRPLTVSLNAGAFDGDSIWRIKHLEVNDDYLHIKGKDLSGNYAQISSGSLQLDETALKDSYAFYFLPIISSGLAQLDIEGSLSASVSFQNNKISDYQLNFSQVNVEHLPETGVQKFAFKNFNGLLHSAAGSVKKDSYLGFDHAWLFETIEFGQIHIPLETTPQSVAVSQTSNLPIFDGELLIEKFRLDFSEKSPIVEFDGVLTPVDLALITDALGWPKMRGKISGVIPAVSYKQRKARIDGILLIKAFDGNILLKDVEASHLLSSWPVLKADVQFIGIDLEQLTQTFEFGLITGLVDGKVDKLVLENWQPTRFDAVFKSSDKSGRKRISQKAVDNISNLGGAGVAGALSRSFLRFFEDFGYDQIGFSCILRDGVCEMDGVAKANQGYYLVKGGGIPRIDVIGHNRQTDWNILVDRLINITEAGAPSIQ